MKNFYCLILMFFISFSLFAQSTEILPGSTTIETLEVNYLKPRLLHVENDYFIPARVENTNHGEETIIRLRGFDSEGTDQHADIALYPEGNIFGLKFPVDNTPGEGYSFVIKNNGNTGFGGVTDPKSTLHINGAIRGHISTGALKIESDHGYIEVGSRHPNFGHIYTDRPAFLLNRHVISSGFFSSYNTADLTLTTQNGTNKVLIAKNNGDISIHNGGIQVKGAFANDTGMLQFNSANNKFEGYNGTEWVSLSPKFDDSEIYVDENGDIGMGTTHPSAKLDLKKTNRLLFELENQNLGEETAQRFKSLKTDGTVKSAEIAFFAEEGLFGIKNSADNTNGAGFGFVLKDNGHIGIGGITNPQENLSVAGRIRSASDTNESQYIAIGHGVSNAFIDFKSNESSNGNLDFRNDGVGLMSLTKEGNLGIGAYNPTYKLDVNGDIYINDKALITNDGGEHNIDHIYHADGNVDGFSGVWHFVSDDTYKAEGTKSLLKAGGIQMSKADGANYIMGNLGIKETDPQNALVVRGTIEADGLVFPDGTVQGTAYSGIAESVVSVPYGAVMAFDGDCPDGWEEVVNAQGRTLIGSGVFVEDGITYTYNNGDTGGFTKVQLTVDELPSHNHIISGQDNTGAPTGGSANEVGNVENYPSIFHRTSSNTGGDQAHENRPPYIAYKICKCTLNNGQNFDARVWTASGDNAYYNKIGNIGIGTTTPQSKLAVNGVITAKEIKAQVDGWGDFVFDENYNLLPLLEVKKYIQSNKHLPKFPTASEIETNGIALAEMQNKAVQKIEELTLYTIQQEEAIQTQSEKITQLEIANKQKEEQIEALTERLTAIEKHLGLSKK